MALKYMKLAVNKMMLAVDVLLPCSMALFMLPISPRLSSLPIAFWLFIQLLKGDKSSRLVQWPLLILFILSTRVWWFNEPPHPASLNDGLLLICGIVSALSISSERWNQILVLPTIGFLPVLVTLTAKPWTPNPFVGSNQAAYLFGLFFSMLTIFLLVTFRGSWLFFVKFLPVFGIFALLWQTGSRAGLISAVASCFIPFMIFQLKRKRFKISALITTFVLAALYLIRVVVSSNSSLPGLKGDSDLGRMLVYKCYSYLPFTGNNRFLFGVGFDRTHELCPVKLDGTFLDHAHNLYLQIWASTGLLGIIAILLLGLLLLLEYQSRKAFMPEHLKFVWQSASIYTIFQGFFDTSLLHWPVALIVTGVLLGLPLSFKIAKLK